jgi:CheY-like chemotaxis protein
MRDGAVEQDCSTFWLEGGGEAGAAARSCDWSSTALGPVESWPVTLKAIVGVMLRSRHPMFLWWGPELIQIYNDAYIPSFGAGKHPAAMGQRGEDCWPEVWPIIHPQIDDVMSRARASWNEDHLVSVWRGHRMEEAYWTYGFSPVFVDARTVGGTLVICTETTRRVLAERRHRALRSLAKSTALATTAPAVLSAASELFEETPGDVPFALIYVTERTTGEPVLWRTVGLGSAEQTAVNAACRATISMGGRGPIDLGRETHGVSLPGRPWAEPSTSAFVVPLGDGRIAHTGGFLVLGLSPRLPFDAAYREHLVQIAEHVGLVLARIETYRPREPAAVERDDPMAGARFDPRRHRLAIDVPPEGLRVADAVRLAQASKRVLVVDDDEDSAELLREMLQWVGHEVEVAHDGPSALAMVDRFTPDVAVLDIGLPVMDGYELGRRLHERPRATRCRLIALSGYGQERERAQSKATGFEAHLVKPVDARRLLQAVAGQSEASQPAR